MKTSAILALALAAPADAAGRRLEENLDMHKLLDAGKQGRVGSTINFKLDKAHKLKKVAGATLKKLKHFLDSEDHDGVAYIEPELEHKTMFQANDPELGSQPHYDAIKLPGAWDTTMGNPDVVVRSSTRASTWSTRTSRTTSGRTRARSAATASTTTTTARRRRHGYNFADDTGTDLMGNHWHGTRGGTIAADTNNGKGAGVAGGDGSPNSGAKLMIGVTFGDYSSAASPGLVYGANNGAQISSNSWGYMQSGIYDQAELDAIDYYNSKDGLVVFAAGNDADDGDWYPAYYDGAIAVAATDNNGVAAGFTCYGDWIDISAPGVGIYSTMADEGNYYSSGDYGYSDGTSMACPHVAGVLALGKSVNMAADRRHLLQCMADTAMDTDGANSGTYAGKLGAGLVNAEAFVECAANGAPSKSPTVSPAPTTAAPSLRPTISPAPTPDCGCNQQLIFHLKTDLYPGETTYQFKALDAPAGCVDEGVLKGGPYGEVSHKYDVVVSEQVCVGVTYEFKVLDSFGDGMCCGQGEGGFELALEGTTIHAGGQFGSEDVFEFTSSADGVEAGPTPAPVSGGGDDESNWDDDFWNDGDDWGWADDDFEDEDALPTMQVTEVYKALAHKKIGKLAIFSWEAEEVDSDYDYSYGEWRKLAGKNKKDKKKGKSGCPKGKAGKACRKAEKEGKNWEYYYGDYEPEIYAGNFRLEIRYGKNAEYEMLTEQVVAESTDGKYYFVMPEADCGKKVQVRVTGLGPDGDETEAVESKAKKLKC
ncbi:serine-type endopeptidase [Aureococcus anophagefferens]|nr:serine-type endopeptidase [Aureococcus anophagefferens]